jgi:branched-chain amino acid transport system ATP-binding protein
VHAVEKLSFAVEPGAIHAVIGPNGAGKTTLFNLITGIYRPSAGRIWFRDEEIGHRRPDELARRGLGRTFQNLQICFNMSAVENVMLGRHQHLDAGFLPALLRLPRLTRSERGCRDRALELLEFVGIAGLADVAAGALPYGLLKRLEIARAIAAEPTLLLLDEPAAGLNPTETAEVDELIRRVVDTGVTVLLVEHDMKLVMGISDHILVLDYGRKLGEGTAEEVRRNPDVIAAYLGAGAAESGHG